MNSLKIILESKIDYMDRVLQECFCAPLNGGIVELVNDTPYTIQITITNPRVFKFGVTDAQIRKVVDALFMGIKVKLNMKNKITSSDYCLKIVKD